MLLHLDMYVCVVSSWVLKILVVNNRWCQVALSGLVISCIRLSVAFE